MKGLKTFSLNENVIIINETNQDDLEGKKERKKFIFNKASVRLYETCLALFTEKCFRIEKKLQ